MFLNSLGIGILKIILAIITSSIMIQEDMSKWNWRNFYWWIGLYYWNVYACKWYN